MSISIKYKFWVNVKLFYFLIYQLHLLKKYSILKYFVDSQITNLYFSSKMSTIVSQICTNGGSVVCSYGLIICFNIVLFLFFLNYKDVVILGRTILCRKVNMFKTNICYSQRYVLKVLNNFSKKSI